MQNRYNNWNQVLKEELTGIDISQNYKENWSMFSKSE